MINKQPQIHFVYDRRKTASQKKSAALEMKITCGGKTKFLSTGIHLYPNQWKNGCITNCPDTLQLSQKLNSLLIEVRQALLECDDLSMLPKLLHKEEKDTFFDFCKKRATIRKYGKEKDTQERYDRFLKMFRTWGGIVEVEDITDDKIIAYDHYMKDKGMKTYSRWNNYHRFLNSFIIDAMDERLLQRNPYKWVNIEKGYTSIGINKYLTPDEFRRIRCCKLHTESLERVRDVFVFQTYTCLSYSDLREMDFPMIQEIKGMKVYVGNRRKTEKPFTIPILSPAWDILMKYEGKLPIISNPKYNEYLKVVAQCAGIDKPVSSHWARHTGATLLLNEGVDLKAVARICGHSSVKITEQIYAKLLDKTVVDAVSNLEI